MQPTADTDWLLIKLQIQTEENELVAAQSRFWLLFIPILFQGKETNSMRQPTEDTDWVWMSL